MVGGSVAEDVAQVTGVAVEHFEEAAETLEHVRLEEATSFGRSRDRDRLGLEFESVSAVLGDEVADVGVFIVGGGSRCNWGEGWRGKGGVCRGGRDGIGKREEKRSNVGRVWRGVMIGNLNNCMASLLVWG